MMFFQMPFIKPLFYRKTQDHRKQGCAAFREFIFDSIQFNFIKLAKAQCLDPLRESTMATWTRKNSLLIRKEP